MVENEYTVEPSTLPHNVTISRDSALNVNRGDHGNRGSMKHGQGAPRC